MKLPLNCEVEYFPDFLTKNEADTLYQYLINEPKLVSRNWSNVNGEMIQLDIRRLIYTEEEILSKNGFPKEIWGDTQVWTPEIKAVKRKMEILVKNTFQVAVCLYYPDGNTWADYHSDFVAYGDTTVIPSLSLGEKREFCLKEKSTGEVHSQILEHGSLIVMGKHCQERYEHAILKDPSCKKGRVNITFRKYGYD